MIINATKNLPHLILIKENPSEYTRHDQLFKQLIKAFFEEFLEAFFPDIHEQIDFERIIFLSEEMFTGVYEGDKRILDLVVEVKLKTTDALIVVHIEPQSYKQTDFNDRMFNYYSMLYNRVKKLVIPIAVFSYEESWDKSDFIVRFLDYEILTFNYLTIHLRKQNWRSFIKKDNPIAGALLSKMGYADNERVQVKLEFFQTLARLRLDREKNDLLIGFFESYLKLTDEEEAVFVKEASKLKNAEEVLELPISYEERGKKIGREEGLEKGLAEGRIKERKEVARNMLNKGLDIELIKDITKLSLDEIEQLKKQL